jgi:hypothetical protein
MQTRKLPWSTDSYTKLEPGDLDPTPPTPEQRIRVAAALLTQMRDDNMIGLGSGTNAEVVRAILTMNDDAWWRDIGGFRGIIEAFDGEDPRRRWEQVSRASQG